MGGNTFGKYFRLTTYGESHGKGIGAVIDGCPAGLPLDEKVLLEDLRRRRPGQSELTTQRSEADIPEILSGVMNGITTGTPISIFIANRDQQSKDYDALKDVYRPSHADFTYQAKYGIRDHRGGGRSSARETAARVAAGAIARQLLATEGIAIAAWVSQVYDVEWNEIPSQAQLENRFQNAVRCPDDTAAQNMIKRIEEAKAEGDSLGGIISCSIRGVPPGLGEPVFDKLHADLGKAMLSINAVKGFEIGSGFKAVGMKGSEHNDAFVKEGESTRTKTNHSGGIQGGISNGETIFFRVAFKPVASIAQAQETLNARGERITLETKGRHDPCVVPRAVPIVEAMAALVLADHWLARKLNRI